MLHPAMCAPHLDTIQSETQKSERKGHDSVVLHRGRKLGGRERRSTAHAMHVGGQLAQLQHIHLLPCKCIWQANALVTSGGARGRESSQALHIATENRLDTITTAV